MRTTSAAAGAAEPPAPGEAEVPAARRDPGGERPLAWRSAAVRDPIHGTVAPADVRAGDPVIARVRVPGTAGELAAQVWRISPLGAELVRTPALAAIGVGRAIDLTIEIGASVAAFSGLSVLALRAERGRELLAVRWADASGAGAALDDREKREASRWPCGDDYLPTGVAENAACYDDLVHFRVVEISRTGMRLLTSLRNKFLIPGVAFEAACAFPTMGEARVAFRVVHARVVHQGPKRWLALGVTYTLPDPRSAELIGQYLLQFGPGASVQDLRATGFRVRSSSRALEFGCVSSEGEYRQVLALRRLAYLQAKKISAEVKDVEMADGYDARARILVAKHRGRVIATVRLVFPRGEDDRLKHEDFLALPPDLPPRAQIVEFSKFCTDPEFRGSDLFYTLVKRSALTTMQSGRRFALMSCTEALAPLYARVGFRKVGAAYVHPSMRLEHHLMLGEVARIVSGKGVNPVVWNLMGGWDLWSFAKRCGVAPRSAWLEARVAFYRLFKPLARLAAAIYVRRNGARGWRG